MKITRVLVSILILGLLVSMSRSASASEPRQLPSNGGCAVGGGYDPICDVDRSGLIDVVDIMLVAGHWREAGTWSSDSWGLTGNAGTDPSTNFLGTTDGQDLIINPDSGGVGIGTTDPAFGRVQVDQTSDNDEAGIAVRNSSGARTLRLWVDASNVARVDSGNGGHYDLALNGSGPGKVGIGTTDPEDKLVIGNGETSANVRIPKGGLCIDTNDCTSPGDGGLRVGEGGIHGTDTSNYDLYLVPDDGSVGMGTKSPGNYRLTIKEHVTASGRGLRVVNAEGTKSAQIWVGANGAVLDAEGTTNLHLRTAGTTRMYIDNDGKIGIGTTSPAVKLDVNGTSRTKVLQITGGSDLAEPFDIVGDGNVEPGMVVAIDPEHLGQLRVAGQAYDRTVAGCVSGANGVNPGLTMQQEGSAADGAFPVALSGRVYCWADAAYGSIEPGDLLTTSDTAGHAMAVSDYERAHGAVIGKAMGSLAEGRGLILVLVSLQ